MSTARCREMTWLVLYCVQLIERNHLQQQAASIISVVEAQRWCDTVPLVIATISHIIKASLKCERVSLFKVDASSKLVVQIFPTKATVSSLSAGLLGHVVKNKRFVCYNNAAEKDKLGIAHLKLEKVVHHEHESALFVPVLDDENRTHGIIWAMNRLQDAPFSHLEVQITQLVAIELSALLEKSATKLLLDTAINANLDDQTASLLDFYRSVSVSEREHFKTEREKAPSFDHVNSVTFEQIPAQKQEMDNLTTTDGKKKDKLPSLMRSLSRKSTMANLFAKRLQQLSRNTLPSESLALDEDDENCLTRQGTEDNSKSMRRADTMHVLATEKPLHRRRGPQKSFEDTDIDPSSIAVEVDEVEMVDLKLSKSPSRKRSVSQRRKSTFDMEQLMQRNTAPVATALAKILKLTFDPFAHSAEELGEIAVSMFLDLYLIESLKVESVAFSDFIKEIMGLYRNSNPYHNVYHGFSVLSFAYSFVKKTDLISKFPALDVFALLISALCHDVDHPGNTNAFEIATDSELARQHNDQSVLENHHLNVAFGAMNKSGCNFMSEFSNADRKRFRRIVIQSILATDMSHHFELCSTLDQIDKGEFQQSLLKTEKTDKFKQIICNVFVHTADLTGPVQPLVIALKWGKKVCQEFTDQVEKEKELGLESLPMMQGLENQENFLKSQQGFYKFVLRPLFKSVSRLWPGLNHLYLTLLTNEQYITEELNRIQGNAKRASGARPGRTLTQSSDRKRNSTLVSDREITRAPVPTMTGEKLRRSVTRLPTGLEIKQIFDDMN